MEQQYHDEFAANDDFAGGTLSSHNDQEPRSKPDGTIDPAGEAGWYLERERQARELSLEDVAEATGIHPYHIEAIEYGDMTHMPPRLEALEMIAAYAHFLGFDAEPLLEHYVTFLPRPQVAPRHHPASPAPMMSAKILPFGRFPRIPPLNFKIPNLSENRNGIIASVAVLFSLYLGGSWIFSSEPPAQGTEMIAEAGDPMPTATTDSSAADIKVTETEMLPDALPPVAAVEPEVKNPADELGSFIAQQLGVEDSDPQTVAAVTKPADVGSGKVFGSEDDKVRIVLTAVKPLWLLIEDGQGNRVATQMLSPGDRYRVPNRPGLVAIAQDGGALTYAIDGTDKGILGLPGTLLAAEPLDVKKLEAKS
jgi:cytoskeleton protein RodZ